MRKLLEINNLIIPTGVHAGQIRVSGVLAAGGTLNVRGPSGSGKTSLLRVLARLKEAAGGNVFLEGKAWSGFSPSQWRREVYYLAQKPAVFDGTVQDNLRRPFELAAVKAELQFDPARAGRLMERLFLPGDLLNQDARTLSGGEVSRLALVRALLVAPRVLLLDEPLAALDQKAAAAVLELIAEWLGEAAGRGVVLVSHTGEFQVLPAVAVLDLTGEEGEPGEQ